MAIDITSLTMAEPVKGFLVKDANGNICRAPFDADYVKRSSDGKFLPEILSKLSTDIDTVTTAVNNFLTGEATDNEMMDRLVELVTAISNNKTTIDGLLTDKINVADIADNLTTDSATKVLSAKQGKILKDTMDAVKTQVKVITALPDTATWPSDMADTGVILYIPAAAAAQSGD